ncbi:MAG TPA: YfhO family protein [Anaeromyxobacteraceae bacterium]|nr:YfhO family protein [Anaeromyxobacteraceae bacterium]
MHPPTAASTPDSSPRLAAAGAAEARAWRGVALGVPLAVLAFHWRAALPGMAFTGSDLRIFFYGVREAVAEALRSGALPWWQRGMFMGYPLASDPQAAVFDLATWLTLPWEAPRALTLATLLHLCIAGWGMASWMRRRGLGPLEALLAAVLFALSAKQTAHVIHWNFAASTCWWPWMMAGLEAFAERGRGRHLALTALAAAASWLGGSPQMAHFGSLAAGLYALVLAPGLWRRRPLDAVLAVAAAPAGLLLAAPAVLPAVELARLGPRGSGVSYEFATSWKWSDRWALALFVLPRAYQWRWGLNLWEATGYLGVLPLVLAAAAPRRRGVPLFLVLGVLGVWLGFGEDSWLGLHRFLYRFLPGYGAFRVPTRFLMVTTFASALLAAEGLAALRREGFGARARRGLWALGAVAAAALLLPRLPGFPFDAAAGRLTAWTAVALAAGGAAFLAFGHAARGRALALGAVALSATDLYLAFGDMNPTGKAARQHPVLGEFAPLVPAPPEPRRVGVIAAWGASANAPLRLGWEGTLGYGPMNVERVSRLLEATRHDRLPPPGPITGDTNFPRARPASRLWPLLGTPLVISDQPLPLPRLMVGEGEWYVPLVAHRAEALPRVFWAGAWSVEPDERLEGDGSLLAAAAGDRAVLAEAPPGLPPAGAPEGPLAAEEVRVGRDWLTATVVAPRDGVAVILDPFYPGWRAALDGAPAPIVRADYAFMAVPVKAGRHGLRLEFRDPLLSLGAALSSAALAAGTALLWLRRRRLGRGPP